MKRSKKTAVISIVLAAVLAISAFGYASISQTLDIFGVARVDAKMDVNFISAEFVGCDGVVPYNNDRTYTDHDATPDVSKLTAFLDSNGKQHGTWGITAADGKSGKTFYFNVGKFAQPKAWVEFKVTVRNDGTVPVALADGLTPTNLTSGGNNYSVIALDEGCAKPVARNAVSQGKLRAYITDITNDKDMQIDPSKTCTFSVLLIYDPEVVNDAELNDDFTQCFTLDLNYMLVPLDEYSGALSHDHNA